MHATSTPRVLRSLSAGHRERFMRRARKVRIPQGTRLFEEGGRADRFWIIRTGRVEFGMPVPGRRAAVVESLGHHALVGWSRLFPPACLADGRRGGDTGAGYESDATAVRSMCLDDPALGRDVSRWVGQVLAHRLRSARTRLLDLYAPYGAGSLV